MSGFQVKSYSVIVVFAAAFAFGLSMAAEEKPAKGTLIAVGGGKLPDRILNRFIELAGGANAKLLVISQQP